MSNKFRHSPDLEEASNKVSTPGILEKLKNSARQILLAQGQVGRKIALIGVLGTTVALTACSDAADKGWPKSSTPQDRPTSTSPDTLKRKSLDSLSKNGQEIRTHTLEDSTSSDDFNSSYASGPVRNQDQEDAKGIFGLEDEIEPAANAGNYVKAAEVCEKLKRYKEAAGYYEQAAENALNEADAWYSNIWGNKYQTSDAMYSNAARCWRMSGSTKDTEIQEKKNNLYLEAGNQYLANSDFKNALFWFNRISIREGIKGQIQVHRAEAETMLSNNNTVGAKQRKAQVKTLLSQYTDSGSSKKGNVDNAFVEEINKWLADSGEGSFQQEITKAEEEKKKAEEEKRKEETKGIDLWEEVKKQLPWPFNSK